MKNFTYLFPRGFKPLGFIFTVIGIILAYIRFHYGYKPELFDIKVFALYSHYIESKIMMVIKNQMLEEIAGIFILVGLLLIAFTKEKNETEKINNIRLKSFLISTYINILFLLISILFTFGLGFVYMLIVNMGLWLILYIIIFRVLIIRSRGKLIK